MWNQYEFAVISNIVVFAYQMLFLVDDLKYCLNSFFAVISNNFLSVYQLMFFLVDSEYIVWFFVFIGVVFFNV